MDTDDEGLWCLDVEEESRFDFAYDLIIAIAIGELGELPEIAERIRAGSEARR